MDKQANIIDFPSVSAQKAAFNREALREARLAAMMSQSELARKTNLSAETISNLESGQRLPSGETIRALADELKCPPSYFVTPTREGDRLESVVFFRSVASKTKKQNEALDIWRKRAGRLAEWLSGYVKLPTVNLPDVTWNPDMTDDEVAEAAEELASKCRKMWGLGSGPLGNLIRLAEANGIWVFRLNLGDMDEVSGFSCWQNSRPMVFLTTTNSAARERLSLAHEILHLIAHKHLPPDILNDKEAMKKIEKQAFVFAGAFVLPKESFGNEVFSLRIDQFTQLKRRWGASIAAIGKRLLQIGIMDEDRYVQFRKNLAWNKMLKKEPLDDVLIIEEPLLIKQAVSMLEAAGVTSPSDMAGVFNLSPHAIGQLSAIDPGRFTPVEPKLSSVISIMRNINSHDLPEAG